MPVSTLVPLSLARKTLFPKTVSGKPISPTTAWRWIKKGVLTRGGDRVRLHVKYMGRSPMVSAEMVEEFFDRLAEANQPTALEQPSAETSESTNQQLRSAGLL